MQEAVQQAAAVLDQACQGFVQFLQELKPDANSEKQYRQSLLDAVHGMEGIEWLVPPMLQKS